MRKLSENDIKKGVASAIATLSVVCITDLLITGVMKLVERHERKEAEKVVNEVDNKVVNEVDNKVDFIE